jgi:hypothetical protein
VKRAALRGERERGAAGVVALGVTYIVLVNQKLS